MAPLNLQGNLMRTCIVLAVIAGTSLCSLRVSADITLLGKASIPASATDMSGLDNTIGSGIPHNRLGSFGSGIAYSGRDDVYYAIDDRGPGDGAAAFRCRFQTFEIKIDPSNSAEPVKVTLKATTMLTRSDGSALWGYSGGYDDKDQAKGIRFDPEAIRVSPTGTLWVSDEYGPWIDEFDMTGKQLRRIAPPGKFMVDVCSGVADEEIKQNTKGRISNRGMEGLAITPDGKKLVGIMQSPLIQDGGLDGAHKRVGVNCRILELDIATGATREFVYAMDSLNHGNNEILAINNDEFLVLERDGKEGAKTKARGLFWISLKDASDVSKVEKLPSSGLPADIKPVSKKLWLDLLDPKFGLAGESMPEKIEGIAWGPKLADGRQSLIVVNDNDFRAEVPNWFWVFAVDAKDIPGYQAQQFETK
jgi:hypothetical protein